MKKKLLLLTVLVIALTCLFAIGVSAAGVHDSVDKTQKVTLSDGTELNLFDADGNALIWYIDTSSATGYSSVRADGGAGEEGYTGATVVINQSYQFNVGNNTVGSKTAYECNKITITVNGSDVDVKNIVVVNFMDNEVKTNKGNDFTCFKEIFASNTNLQYAYLNYTTVAIQAKAFSGCTNLKYVNLPDLTELRAIGGGQTFYNCTSLFAGKELDLTNTSLTTCSGNNAFYKAQFTTIKLPDTVTNIDGYVFQETAMTSFRFPTGLTSLGGDGSQFNDSKSLATVTNFENTAIVSPSGRVFRNTAITSIKLPSTMTKIPGDFFNGCGNLASVEISSSVTSIGANVFQNCSALTSVVIPEDVTSIGNYAFAGAGLVTVTFNSTGALTTFGNAVFEKCTSLKALYIPEGVTYLGNCFAKGCSSLASLSLPSTLETLYDNSHFNGTALTSLSGLENTKLTKIPYGAFQGAIDSNIGTLKLPVTCTYIAQYAFADCNVETVILSPALVQMDTEAFVNCPGLKNVYVPGGLTTVASSTFNNKLTGNICFFIVSTDETYLANAKGWFDCKDIVTLEAYNNDKTTYATGRHIISGYNFCVAFYKGVHDTEGVVGVNQFKGADYVTDYICVSGCNRNCGMQAETKLCGPLFTNKGYSKIADGTMFTYGVVINEENIASYVELTGEAFNYGVIIGAAELDENGVAVNKDAIIDNTGKSLIDNSIVVDFSKVELENFTIYNVKMQGIETEAQQKLPIYCCAYIIDGSAVSYMGDSVSDKPTTISSSAITVIETTTTTPTTGEEENA